MVKKTLKLIVYLLFLYGPLSSAIIITEIADPNDGGIRRYLEIYNTGESSVALSDYHIIRYTNANNYATSSIDLSSYTLAAKSFLIFAVDATTFNSSFSVGSNTTVIDAASGGPADSNGDDNIAIVTEASGQTFDYGNSSTYDYVDIFGNPGTKGTGNWHEFEDGRAERVATQTTGVTSSTSSAWNCWSDAELFLAGVDQNAGNSHIESTDAFSSNGFDPGAWDGHVSTTINGSVGFRLMSTPVSNGTYTDLLAELWTQGMTGSDAAGAADDNVWGFTLGSGAAGTWSAVSNLGATMTPGAGFLVYVFTDTDNDGDNDLPVNLSVGGSENSGNVTYPASGSIDASQYGLAGNPYYTTIDFDDVTKNNVEATVYVYDDAKSGGAGYISWNGSSGSLTNGLIAPFQGFWVQATGSGSGSIQIQEADKSTSSGTFYRLMDTEQVGSMYLEFSDNNGGYSKTWFSYNTDGEVGKDSRDAHRLMPLMATSRLAAMSFAGDQALDINNLPYDHGSDVDVPLDVMSLQLEDEQYVTGASEVSMSWNTDNLPEHIELTLTDNLTGDVIDLNNELDYTFTTEPKGSFSATYQEAVGIYPLLGDARFTLHTSYGALDNEHEVALPSVYALDPVYPNPFNPRTTVRFDVPEVSRVELEVYDITGSLVETLLDQKMVPGGHQYSWEPKSLSTGVYFLKLHTANQTFTQKVTYVK